MTMPETTLTHLDGYCERAGMPGLWAEPVDVISNIAFLIAAYLAWRKWGNAGGKDISLLIALLAAIGVGSAIWHLAGSGVAVLFDVIPILLFMNVYLMSFLVRVAGCGWRGAVIGFLAFQMLNAASETFLPRGMLNGSVMYLPAYSVLALMTLYLFRTRHPAAKTLLGITLLWSLSIAFRTMDMTICPMFPLGTHFLWHILNAVVLYKLIGLLAAAPQRAAPAG